ncbi:MAG: hypothetical protein N2Z23_05410 [Pyrinomonadaceae bacterium]|nr:hypothetical protein [Pyrinomonadaceae bacterium]MCX7639862.1 hypothetical protein [Pyrinomonadaceae bacterium]MDW8304034.1 hypothetical protein [Acidobacteriota bacterium]
MKREEGFSYMDVIIAMVILMIGVLAAAGALTANLVRAFESEKQAMAKQFALSAIESIFAARDLGRESSYGITNWGAIGNVGSNPDSNGVPQGIFLNGWTPIRQDLGADGIAGTADDACPAPGPCMVGGYTNTSPIIEGFERRIVITNINDPTRPSPPYEIMIRRIDVTVRYRVNQLQREQTVSTIITNYY